MIFLSYLRSQESGNELTALWIFQELFDVPIVMCVWGGGVRACVRDLRFLIYRRTGKISFAQACLLLGNVAQVSDMAS